MAISKVLARAGGFRLFFASFEVYEIDVNEVVRNRLRVAEVWLDEYSASQAQDEMPWNF